jgi:hypothetical protein
VALVVSEDPVGPAVQVALVVSEDLAVQVALVVPEDLVEPVGLVVLEDPAEPAVQESPVAPERELALVAVELEHGPVVLVLVRGHPRAQLAVVALRTKSVTAAHRPDLVPLLEAAEDLAAAVAETTRERVAAEAVIAWEVADTVAVEAAAVTEAVAGVVAAAVAVEAAAADGDKHSMRKNK